LEQHNIYLLSQFLLKVLLSLANAAAAMSLVSSVCLSVSVCLSDYTSVLFMLNDDIDMSKCDDDDD